MKRKPGRACRIDERARAGLVLLFLLLPGFIHPATAYTVVPIHKLVGTLDGKPIELGQIHFILQQALTPDIGLDEADMVEFAREHFGTAKPALELTLKPQPGSRHAGRYYDKAPIVGRHGESIATLVRVAGGGASVALPVIRRRIPHAEIVKDPPWRWCRACWSMP